MSHLLEPFQYDYMNNALLISALICAVCAFLSAFLMLKGWSLIADALSHATVPGVAIAYFLGLPFSIGAFISGGFAAFAILFLKQRTILKEDVAIGVIFTTFFAIGLFILSISPSSVNLQLILMGNILAISPFDQLQMLIISLLTLAFLTFYWKHLLIVFFDEAQAIMSNIKPIVMKILFFSCLSATTLAAMQAVGALLVIAVLVTPGACALLWSDKFHKIILISIAIGVSSALLGTYLSYFFNGATGAMIVCLQTTVFILSFLFAPKYGLVKATVKKPTIINRSANSK